MLVYTTERELCLYVSTPTSSNMPLAVKPRKMRTKSLRLFHGYISEFSWGITDEELLCTTL
jgi:hypothetical protein